MGVIAWSSLTDQQAVSSDLVGIAAAFGSAVTYAANNVMLRSQAQRDSATLIVLIQQIVPVIVAMPMAVATWATPTIPVWFAFALVGGVSVGGHFLLTWAYRRAQAGVLASADYLALPYAAVLGFFFFGEVPTPAVWTGRRADCRRVPVRDEAQEIAPALFCPTNGHVLEGPSKRRILLRCVY